jgi:hypothetical protein
MKKLFNILVFFLPAILYAQEGWYKPSSINSLWQVVGNAGFSSGEADFISLAFRSSDGQPYVAFVDYGSSRKATVMRFDGTNWVNVGSAGFSAGRIWYTSLAISPSGQPYVAYKDSVNSLKATVMGFNGTNWVTIGNAGFSGGEAEYTSLAFSQSGQPYVAYENFETSSVSKVGVMKFDGTNWVYVGNAGLFAGSASYLSLAFSSTDGQPYVAYQDQSNLNKATVMKFDGTSWVNVGNAGFSAGEADWTSLAISSSGQPYVAYQDQAIANKATVMKFNGTNWVYVGNPGFSSGIVACTSLAFSPADGLPYVAYQDCGNLCKATLMRLDGTVWESVGNSAFSAYTAFYTSLAFSPIGQSYIAYQDWSVEGNATVMYYNAPVGINEIQESGLSLYPNPASKVITIEITGEFIKSHLSITNIEGQELIAQAISESKTQLDISRLPNGVYFVRLANDKSIKNGKIIKQ